MCQILLKNNTENKKFIIYNYVFFEKNATFTIEQLMKRLENDSVFFAKNEVEDVVNDFVKEGILNYYYGNYVVEVKQRIRWNS